jgi:hypothetical protein
VSDSKTKRGVDIVGENFMIKIGKRRLHSSRKIEWNGE